MIKTTFWVLGFGKIGQMAVKKIKLTNHIHSNFIVIDNNSNISKLNGLKIIYCDAIDWLSSEMSNPRRADWIIPALPLHVFWEFLYKRLMKKYTIKSFFISRRIRSKLPNVIITNRGEVCVSYADGLCPINCPEPSNICFKNGEPRPTPMFKLLEQIKLEGIRHIGIQSEQLLPGLGGYSPKSFDLATNLILKYPKGDFMISTACKCHGIINFIKIT